VTHDRGAANGRRPYCVNPGDSAMREGTRVRQNRTRLLAAVTGMALAGSLAIAGVAGASVQARHTHPGPAGRRIAAKAPPGVVNSAIAGATKSYALNWSGYAQNTATKGTYTAVRDYWTVPTVNTKASGSQYSSDWVGIDGYSNSSLIQCGTEGYNVSHAAHYDAWTEILPASEVVIPGLVIHPGNKMEGLVEETSPGTWVMTVFDLTTGKSGGRTVTYSTPGQSAEAVHERPEVGGSLATLAKTGKVTLDPGAYSTSVPSTKPVYQPLMTGVTGATVYQIFMLNNAGTKIIAAPSLPDSDGDGFALADGATSPAPPSS
jgi:Peptidase A4 family